MVLSNVEILDCIEKGYFSIAPLQGNDPTVRPFNTTSIDLRLSNKVFTPVAGQPIALDMSGGEPITTFLVQNTVAHIITKEQPWRLTKGSFVLGTTLESVSFPIGQEVNYSARVEGKSSIARCGILIHFTAPTIHTNFSGPITLEIANLGDYTFLLSPGMSICQLIIEEVKGCPLKAPSQFAGQVDPTGSKN